MRNICILTLVSLMACTNSSTVPASNTPCSPSAPAVAPVATPSTNDGITTWSLVKALGWDSAKRIIDIGGRVLHDGTELGKCIYNNGIADCTK